MEILCPECPFVLNSLYSYSDHRKSYHGDRMMCFVNGCGRSGFKNIRQHIIQAHSLEAQHLLQKKNSNDHNYCSSSVVRETINVQGLSECAMEDSSHQGNDPITEENDFNDSVDMVDEGDQFEPYKDPDDLDLVIKSVLGRMIQTKEEKLMTDVQFVQFTRIIFQEMDRLKVRKDFNYILEELRFKFEGTVNVQSLIKSYFPYTDPECHIVSGKMCYRIPVKSIIERKLKDEWFAMTIIEAQKKKLSEDIVEISSFRDTSSFREETRKIFYDHIGMKNVLIIFGDLYLDDFNCANPIGPFKGSSSMTGVYMNFLDIERKDRLRREDQCLVSIIPVEHVNDSGYHYSFSAINKELLELESSGFKVNLFGEEYLVKFIVLKIVGDNKSMFEILGKNVSFNHGSICRVCTATHNQIIDDPFSGQLMTKRSWAEDIERVRRNDNVEGLREEPTFSGFKYIPIHNQYPSDRLHNLLLGVYPDFLELVIEDVISTSEIGTFNEIIKGLKFKNGSLEVREGSSKRRNKRSMTGSGAQNYDMFLNFPELLSKFIFRDKPYPSVITCDEFEEWDRITLGSRYQTYLVLRSLDCYLRQQSFNNHDLTVINFLVKAFFKLRSRCCGDQTITPKLHYLTHLAHEIKTHGPLDQYDNLPYERKHHSFIRKVHSINCRRNISKTLVEWESKLSAIREGQRNDLTLLGSQQKLTVEEKLMVDDTTSVPLFKCSKSNENIKTSSGNATGSGRNKVALAPGHSLMDWIKKSAREKDMAGTGGVRLKVTREELSKHNTADDCWLVVHGKVYNVTPYLHFHPGGVDEMMKGAGIDATELFNEVHQWVNFQSMLKNCLVGDYCPAGVQTITSLFEDTS